MSSKKIKTEIVYSEKLKRILFSIGTKTAMSILEKEHCCIENFPYSYIDTTSSPETLSFILSGKTDVDDVWKNDRRNDIRCGKIFGKIIPETSKENIEKLVNAYKSKYKIIFTNAFDRFKIVDGIDIKKYYNYRAYITDEGPLTKSCMRYDECGDYMRMYTKNPQTVRMLVLFDIENPSKICGRALLWELKEPQNRILMDRIYYVYDSDCNLFKDYARQNEWLFKSEQKIDGTIYDGEFDVDMRVSAEIRKFKYKYFPYLDTLKYYHRGILANYQFNDRCIELRDGHGGSLDPNSVKRRLHRQLQDSSIEHIYDMYGEQYIFSHLNKDSWKENYYFNYIRQNNIKIEDLESNVQECIMYLENLCSFKNILSIKKVKDRLKNFDIEFKSFSDFNRLPVNDLKMIIKDIDHEQTFCVRILRKINRSTKIKDILLEKYDNIRESLQDVVDYLDWNSMIECIINDVVGDEEEIQEEGPFEEDDIQEPNIEWEDNENIRYTEIPLEPNRFVGELFNLNPFFEYNDDNENDENNENNE